MADDARAMLDALMGANRDAPIDLLGPSRKKGRKSKKSHSSGSSVPVVPDRTPRKPSCYDPDICPHYTTWGVDLYDLFVNTKSDIGNNPNIVSELAAAEYKSLPPVEKERLGFDRDLFFKLRDLVRQVDRVVTRNREKLRAEVDANSAKGYKSDPIKSINEGEVQEAGKIQARLDLLEEEILELVDQLENPPEEENEVKKEESQAELEKTAVNGVKEDTQKGSEPDSSKLNEVKTEAVTDEELPEVKDEANKEADVKVPDESKLANDQVLNEEEAKVPIVEEDEKQIADVPTKKIVHPTSTELIHRISTKITSEYQPLSDSLLSIKRHLKFFRGDTTSDKHVCEISGNFMSSRDADERIAAHFAGRQFVGWKLVREKFKELDRRFKGGRMMGNERVLLPFERQGYKLHTQGGNSGPGGRGHDRGRNHGPPPPGRQGGGFPDEPHHAVQTMVLPQEGVMVEEEAGTSPITVIIANDTEEAVDVTEIGRWNGTVTVIDAIAIGTVIMIETDAGGGDNLD
eukprot:CAMPEP_0194359300 /NCGR_PEP_ID=MMETSP0174-20130528/6556_1 /TAXON_ID=216777 /ORGANISM="Proboscia alata, Strain PI-D3" /LENGTH=516 /DNA_ID=CAMNT_0039130123 /DNA_START=86 /DNA_END=1637 /DNA_ORIENTATION=+